jgi:hypothetical protein
MAYEVALTALDKVASVLPKLILKKIYTTTKLNEQLLIDTRRVNPVIFYLTSSVPNVNAWFTLTNFTNLIWKVHDFSVDIWLGQPLVTAICHDKPPDISRKTRSDIFTKCELNEFQVNRLKEWKDRQTKGQVDNVSMYVNAHLESKIGLVELRPTLENPHIIVQ